MADMLLYVCNYDAAKMKEVSRLSIYEFLSTLDKLIKINNGRNNKLQGPANGSRRGNR